jgi:glycosyltransferase involved in cell wall biosynthesis
MRGFLLRLNPEAKLLFYVESPFVSGAEAQIIRNVSALAKEGVDTVLIAAIGSGQIAAKFDSIDAKQRLVVRDVKLPFSSTISPVARVLVDQARLLLGLLRGLLFARRLRPTVVHINNGGFPGAAGARGFALGAKLGAGGAHLIMTVNNLAVDYSSIARKFDFFVDKALARRVSTWVTGSKAASARLIEVLKLENSKTTVIPNGIPTLSCPNPQNCPESSSLAQIDGYKFALSVGLLEKRKGHARLLQALRILAEQQGLPVDWLFLIEGSGPEQNELENQIQELGLSRQVRLLGNSKCLFHLMSRSEVFIHPSISNEDLPNVITEAMSLGKPIIGSRLAGIPEQIDDGVNGFLVAPGSAQELAAKIDLLIRDSDKRKTLGLSSEAKYQQDFLPEVALERYKRLYGLDNSFEH